VKISGFTFLYNVLKNDYPFIESIKSLLPLVDEYVILLLESDDGTEEKLMENYDKKMRIIKVKKENIKFPISFGYYTTMALRECTGDFCFYLQADEVLHEKYIPYIKTALEFFKNKKHVEGFLLKYKHFFGNYKLYHEGYGWYEKEIRIVRNIPEIFSFKNAKSFRKKVNGEIRRVKCVLLDAYIYHYGWVKPKEVMIKKLDYFHKIKGEKWDKKIENPYTNVYGLKKFKESHPDCMKRRIKSFHGIKIKSRPPKLKKKIEFLLGEIFERTFKRRFFSAYHYVLMGKYKKFSE
jgi:glycosyltransferase involved in cell wall biosynthesis